VTFPRVLGRSRSVPFVLVGRLCTAPFVHWAACALGRLCCGPGGDETAFIEVS
jgi:hypothetical protein